MQTYELMVYERSVRAVSNDTTLVRTSIGVDQIHVLFDNSEWLSFPVTVTFGNGSVIVTQSMQVTSMLNSQDWAAQGTVTIPFEVIRNVGPIRVTFQGTDSLGNHIITAYGEPLEVEEAGDVTLGDVPEDAPTVDQWTQAYADAVSAANDAASVVSELSNRVDAIVSAAQSAVADASAAAIHELERIVEGSIAPASRESLGVVRIGAGLGITDDGVISSETGLTDSDRTVLRNIVALAMLAFGSDVTANAYDTNVSVNPSILPVATVTSLGTVMPDGITAKVDANGMLRCIASGFVNATVNATGAVKPDGTTITIDEDGTIHSTAQSTDAATTSRYGVVKYDGESISENESGQICVTGYEDLVSAVDNLASRLSDVEEMLSLVAYDSGMIVFPTNDVMQGEVIVGGEYDNGAIQY